MKYLFSFFAIMIVMSAWVRPAQASFIVHKSSALGLSNGLVGWWTFDGKSVSGTGVDDMSGNGNRGTLTSGPIIGVGKLGQGISFDGVNDYVNLGDSSTLQPSNLTVSLWMLTVNNNGSQRLIRKRTFGYAMNLNPNGTLDFLITDSGATDYNAQTTSVLDDNKWHHIVGVYDGSLVRVYVDGKQEASHSAGTISYGGGAVALGRDGDSAALFYKGLLDDVRVYNRVLSADEIKRLYNMGGTVKLGTSRADNSLGQARVCGG